jgi:hypothetical protein
MQKGYCVTSAYVGQEFIGAGQSSTSRNGNRQMTTAALRNEARAAQANLQWAVAADLYAKAIAAYPIAQRKDGLAAADVANMENKRAQCLRMVEA